jgi:CRP-like cAMP-binding protein
MHGTTLIMQANFLNKLQQNFSHLVSFSLAEWEAGVSCFTIKSWLADETVFAAGSFPSKIHFIIEGRARYFYLTHDGVEKTKSIIGTGGTLASMSTLVSGAPSPFYVQTLTPCITAIISYDNLMSLADTYHSWNTLIRKLLEQLALKKERREASFLLLNARQRYEQFLTEFGEQADEIPLRHVAMYLGITDVSLSRIRKEMGLT